MRIYNYSFNLYVRFGIRKASFEESLQVIFEYRFCRGLLFLIVSFDQ